MDMETKFNFVIARPWTEVECRGTKSFGALSYYYSFSQALRFGTRQQAADMLEYVRKATSNDTYAIYELTRLE